jgi:hypothetical protein
MPQSDKRKQDLAELDRRLAKAEMGITRQTMLMDRLARHGRETADAHAILNEMKGALAGMYTHRRMLARRLG